MQPVLNSSGDPHPRRGATPAPQASPHFSSFASPACEVEERRAHITSAALTTGTKWSRSICAIRAELSPSPYGETPRAI